MNDRLRHRPDNWLSLGTALVLGAGTSLGLFLSRVLAETPRVTWPFYEWWPTLALVMLSAGGLLVAWRARRRAAGESAAYLPFYALLIYVFQPAPDPLQASVLLVGMLVLHLLLSIRALSEVGDAWIALLLFATATAIYMQTLTPAVGTRDGYELQAISATLGFAHPTGYPLFPILGRLWLLVFPFRTIAWRINVLCALYAAASVSLVYGTARRVLGHRSLAALSALVFAFSATLWAQAVRPEKYTLNALFVSLVLYVAFGAVDPEERGPYPRLRWLALVYGLSLGHHRTMLMLAPPLAVYVLWRDPSLLKRPKEWLSALGIALAAQLIYLYIPWRAAAQGWYMTVPEFLRYISGAYYGPAVRLMDWANPERVRMFWRFTVDQFGYTGVVLGALGVGGLALRQQWRFLACSGLAYATYYLWGTVWYAYYNDVNSFIPNHMLLSIWIGSGALVLWDLLLRLPRYTKAAKAAFWTLLALFPMWLAWTNAPQVDASNEWNQTHWGALAIAQDIAPGATILADREKHPPLDYAARIEDLRPDVDIVILGDEQAYLERLAWDLLHDKAVYLARFLPGLEGPYYLRSLGPLVEVGTTPLTVTENVAAPPAEFGDCIQLLQSDIEEQGPLSAGDTLHATLHWRAQAPVRGNYQVALRLASDRGQVWWEDSEHPVNGTYPTAAWKPSEVVVDWHAVPIAETVPPGVYHLEVGLFVPFSSQGLTYDKDRTWLPLRDVEIVAAPPPQEIPRRLRAIQPGGWQIIGYDLPPQAPPTSRVVLALYWQALSPLPDLEVGTRLVTAGETSSWAWEVPGRGEYPTSRWVPGQTVVTDHRLTMPSEPGKAVVQVAVRPSGQQAAVRFYPRWLAPQGTVLSLPEMTVSGRPPASPGTHNYDDRILLVEADLAPQSLSPGSPLDLDARWECLKSMDADYTLFVQLLAPDGSLRGQIDVWPRNGTHPTSRWQEGEEIEDRYRVHLDHDAPPGAYQLAIGWYLLGTMERLSVLDEEGRAIDDKVLLGPLTVE